MKLLLIEDEDRIASFLEHGLVAHGYEVHRVATGAEAIEQGAVGFDLVILDLGLPDMDGLEVIARLRNEGLRAPIIVLTARGDVVDRVEGLDRGADDYLAKPFAFDELLARIRAQVRALERRLPTILEAAGIRMNLISREVAVDGREVELTTREFTLLEKFLRAPGAIYSREQLLEEIWGIDFDPRSNLVDVYVGYLRRKLGRQLIETVRAEGYRLRDIGRT
jgi:two-component system, OmpR family, response regulator